MKKTRLGQMLTLIFAATWIHVGSATELGDPAPALKVKEWLKGDKVSLAEGNGKNIYVVDFWATWSPPCRISVPHLSDLQRQFKEQGVVFVGISDEPASVIKPFVEEQGDKMSYTVAVDDNHQTSAAYIGAFGVGGIPHSFVVNKEGKVVWHGHPMGDLRNVLQQVLTGRFDVAAARRAAEADKASQKYLSLAANKESGTELTQLGETVVKDGARNPELLNHFSWAILTGNGLKTRDLELALKAAKAAHDATDGKQAPIVDTYARALFETGKIPEAVAMQKKAVEIADEGRMKEAFEKTLQTYGRRQKAE